MKEGNILAEGKTEEVITTELMKDVYNVNVVFRHDEEIGYYLMPVSI